MKYRPGNQMQGKCENLDRKLSVTKKQSTSKSMSKPASFREKQMNDKTYCMSSIVALHLIKNAVFSVGSLGMDAGSCIRAFSAYSGYALNNMQPKYCLIQFCTSCTEKSNKHKALSNRTS